MSETRPASEFSIGSMARSARPDVTASKARSKVAQGIGSNPGAKVAQASSENAPGSP